MLNINKDSKPKQIFDFLHEHIIVIIIAMVVLAGVISTVLIIRGDATPETTEETVTEYEDMNTLHFAMDQVGTLNPLTTKEEDVYYIAQLIYSSLFRLDDGLGIEKDLVDTYNANSSEGSVSIKLRSDAKFSDGTNVTAEDVRFSVNQILSNGNRNPYYPYVEKISYVSVTGTRSLTITFDDPSDAALDNLVFPIVSSRSYDYSSNRNVGSGQYAYASYDKNKYLRLKPNENYYGTVATNRLRFKIVPNSSSITGLMTMDAVTAYVSDEQGADADAEDKNLNVTAIPSSELEYLGFNFDNEHLAKKEVRQAIAMAVDTESLIKDNYGGNAISSDSIFYPGFLGTENAGDTYEKDQRGASILLSEAGFDDINEDGFLEDEDGNPFELTIVVNSGNTSRSDAASGIADELENVGIRVTVRKLSWTQYRRAVNRGNFDMYLGGYKFDKIYNLKDLFKTSNNIGYKNSQVRSDVYKLETCLTAKSMRSTYDEIKATLTDEIPYYCICYKAYSFITVNHFTGETTPTFFDVYRGCDSWKWQKAVTTRAEVAV